MWLGFSGVCSAHYRTGLNRGENGGKLHATKPSHDTPTSQCLCGLSGASARLEPTGSSPVTHPNDFKGCRVVLRTETTFRTTSEWCGPQQGGSRWSTSSSVST